MVAIYKGGCQQKKRSLLMIQIENMGQIALLFPLSLQTAATEWSTFCALKIIRVSLDVMICNRLQISLQQEQRIQKRLYANLLRVASVEDLRHDCEI